MRQTSNSFRIVRVLEECHLLEYPTVPALQMLTHQHLQASFLNRHLAELRRRLVHPLMQHHRFMIVQEDLHRQRILPHHPLSTLPLLDILRRVLVTPLRRLRSLRHHLGTVRNRHRSARPPPDILRRVHHSAQHLHDIHQPHPLTCHPRHPNTPRRHQWLRPPLPNIHLLRLLIHQHLLLTHPHPLGIAQPHLNGRLRAQLTTRMGRHVPTTIRQSHHMIEKPSSHILAVVFSCKYLCISFL